MSLDNALVVVAAVFFILATFGSDIKINAVAAGLLCLTLTLLT